MGTSMLPDVAPMEFLPMTAMRLTAKSFKRRRATLDSFLLGWGISERARKRASAWVIEGDTYPKKVFVRLFIFSRQRKCRHAISQGECRVAGRRSVRSIKGLE